MAPRTIVYIDGFNLYYGSVRGTPYKWLNIEKLCRYLRKDDIIERIHYFSALVDTHHKQRRQLTYLRALNTLPSVTTWMGRFKNKVIKCGIRQCQFQGLRRFTVPEEKYTDVAIAVQILDDAVHDRMDNLVLFSGDSDLVPPLGWVRGQYPKKKIMVYIPAPRKGHIRAAAVELRAIADKAKALPMALIRHCQFPREFPGVDGQPVTKPDTW